MFVIVLSTAVVSWVYVDGILESDEDKQQTKIMLAHQIMAALSFCSTSVAFVYGLERVMKLKKPVVLIILIINAVLAGILLPMTILLCDGLGLQAESATWQSAFVVFRCLIIMLQGPNSSNEVYKLLRRNIRRAKEKQSKGGDGSSASSASKSSKTSKGGANSTTSQTTQSEREEEKEKESTKAEP
ncbi:hypothetical protein TL16_g00864 [Triparma laevis f. inornata]|uniref:Uncharacterized protein n=1 Tax=Triparma laevis f. inornata TaxID=1714386 RepID=A0A9W6ZAU2_9STRA|nr:hypothetical protein TL16_g00864 [Triparma laevis f. inornata]